MHSFTAFIALAALAHAAPVAQKEAPGHYYEGYLEPYMTYHTRYITIGCSGKQDTQFFTDCCSPMLADEKLETARLPYCIPNATESASASAWEASASASPVAQTESADYEAQSAYANYATSSEVATSTTEAPAPSSTWSPEAAPEPTTQAAPAPSNDEHTGGFATYFFQGGNAGACGQVHSDSDYGVAIDHEIWGSDFSQGSEYCGRSVRVSRGDKSVVAQVWDVCPTCANGNSLDLSQGAFNAIASESEGMVPITWSWA